MSNPATRGNVNRPKIGNKMVPVTPNDSTDLALGACRGVVVAVAGNIDFQEYDGTARASFPVTAGVIHWISVKRILTTSTATGIWAIY